MWHFISLLLLFFLGISALFYQSWQRKEEYIFKQHVTLLETTYNTALLLYSKYAEIIFAETINHPDVPQIMAEAYQASPEQQSLLRGRLYRLLAPAYSRLMTGNLRQLHFHFPDNSSFIRFHQLDRYGDSLTDIRESVRLVNEQHRPVLGFFENGRIFSGFRYIFPLQHNGVHVGSVETSVSFEAIRQALRNALPDHQFMLIQNQELSEGRAFSLDQEIYHPACIAPGFVVEDLRLLGLNEEDPIVPLALELNPQLAKLDRVIRQIRQYQSFALHIQHDGSSYLVTFLPVRNIQDQAVAYLISYEKNSAVADLWHTFRYIILIQLLLFSALGLALQRRLQAMQSLRLSESRLRAITDSMADGMYVNNIKGEIILSNPGMEHILGYTTDELLGRDAHALLHRHKTSDGHVLLDECPLLQATREYRVFQSSDDFFLHKNGSLIPVEVNATPLIMEQGAQGSVVLFRDITERRSLDEERLKVLKLESIGVLAAGIAHDFNNLLTSIQGNIELARIVTASVPAGGRVFHEAIISIKRAAALANRLLTFAEGGIPITVSVELGDYLTEWTRSIMAGSAVSLDLQLDPSLWRVMIDENQMDQVFRHLLQNAMEAMNNQGTVTIQCTNRQIEQANGPLTPGKYVRILVRDHGVGIPEHLLNRIFDPYFTTKERSSIKGSGLGLAIVHSIITRHNGSINVTSASGEGTTFTILLPAADTNPADRPVIQEPPPPRVNGKRILVMDDDAGLLDTICNMLTQLGYTPERAVNGQEAFALYQHAMDDGKPFAAVILDLIIQNGGGGLQTMEQLRQLDPQVAAIVSSGYTNDPVMTECHKYGFLGCIPKPYSLEKLALALEKIIPR